MYRHSLFSSAVHGIIKVALLLISPLLPLAFKLFGTIDDVKPVVFISLVVAAFTLAYFYGVPYQEEKEKATIKNPRLMKWCIAGLLFSVLTTVVAVVFIAEAVSSRWALWSVGVLYFLAIVPVVGQTIAAYKADISKKPVALDISGTRS